MKYMWQGTFKNPIHFLDKDFDYQPQCLNHPRQTDDELRGCETKEHTPVEATSLYEINLVLRKTRFIHHVMEK